MEMKIREKEKAKIRFVVKIWEESCGFYSLLEPTRRKVTHIRTQCFRIRTDGRSFV